MDSLDTPSVSLGLFIILSLIIGNGIFAMTEKAVLSVRRTKLEKQADNGDKKATRILDLIDEPNKVLLALQLGITLIGILIGILTTAELMPAFLYYIENIPFLNEYSTFISWTCLLYTSGIQQSPPLYHLYRQALFELLLIARANNILFAFFPSVYAHDR